MNRSYIHTYRHWVATLEPFQGFQLSLLPICGAFLLFVFLVCLYVCLSLWHFFVFFWVRAASIQADEIFISGA